LHEGLRSKICTEITEWKDAASEEKVGATLDASFSEAAVDPSQCTLGADMISVIILTRDEEEPLLRSLAALAPFATEGLIADVIVADRGSRDATLAVAEAAGCTLVENCGNRTSALERALKLARKSWLLALSAGDMPDREVATALRDHLARSSPAPRPAALLALPPGAGILRRAMLGQAFDRLGMAPRTGLRVLTPPAEAELLLGEHRRWRGLRLRARIGRAIRETASV
jgi:hypothetical protein